ncbi:sodium:solute symporter family protein [Cardinium endosymbiont of Bemisia tabaci]|uniref:sodium:solute symporter family protein n=1 Tax=Cardinium endosymbiont of Bemisia tabaci TaxID=672794 RepID=UPI000442D0A8|nr:sodium:solute symporter family protein [Cardinium endosymbiont of Bemisia tabaci]CDG49515.1 Sodium:solute symporter family protein [Cardinium endosymbiont cBtQ1 of Bemisia tabaci]
MSFETPLLLIAFFLLVTLVIGLSSIKIRMTFQEYAIGKKAFSTTTLVITLLASYYGGGILILNVTTFSSSNFFWIIWKFLINGLLLLTISWLAGYMGKFMYHMSMPETMGRMYGKYTRMITALLSIPYLITFVTIQIKVMSQAINMCIASNSYIVTIVATTILCLYTMFGGIHSVTITDVWQFIVFFSIILILTWLTFKHLNQPMVETISFLKMQKKFELSISNIFFPFQNKLLPILYYLSVIANIEPSIMQVVYMSASPSQAKIVFRYAAFVSCIIMACILLIGLFVFIKMSDLPSISVWDYILTTTSPNIRALICVCLLAMAMSTADSKLHTSAILIVYDLFGSIVRTKMDSVKQILLTRMTIVVVSIFAMLLSFHEQFFPNLLSLLVSTTCIYAVIVMAPFILAVLGFRIATPIAFMGMVTGISTLYAWQKWVSPMVGPTSGTFISILANALFMLVGHYIRAKKLEKIVYFNKHLYKY